MKSKVDWKKVSKSPGYASLKAAYAYELKENEKSRQRNNYLMRDKAEFRREFRLAIGLLMKAANKLNVSLDTALNVCEEDRNYWWLNYYQECGLERICKVIARSENANLTSESSHEKCGN